MIGCAKDKFFDLLCGELGLEWMTDDPRFSRMAARGSSTARPASPSSPRRC